MSVYQCSYTSAGTALLIIFVLTLAPPNNIVKLETLPPYNEIFGFKGSNLIINNSTALESMEGQKYTVVIIAKDLGTPPLSNRTTIEIYIQPLK